MWPKGGPATGFGLHRAGEIGWSIPQRLPPPCMLDLCGEALPSRSGLWGLPGRIFSCMHLTRAPGFFQRVRPGLVITSPCQWLHVWGHTPDAVCDCHPTLLLLFPCEKQIKLLCPWLVDVSASHCTVVRGSYRKWRVQASALRPWLFPHRDRPWQWAQVPPPVTVAWAVNSASFWDWEREVLVGLPAMCA